MDATFEQAHAEAQPSRSADKRVLKGLLHWLPLACLVLLAGWLAVGAFAVGSTNLYAYALRTWHERWADDSVTWLTRDNLQVAEQVSGSMLITGADVAFYQTLAAKQAEWRNFYQLVLASDTEDKPLVNQHNLQQAYAHYYEAIRLRPSWPDSYVAVARNRIQAGEPTDQWYPWLEQALAIAPSGLSSLMGAAELGLRFWPELSSDQRRQVSSALFTLVDYPAAMWMFNRQLVDAEARQRACALLQFSKHVAAKPFCK
ncbi:hypothetical protein [Aliagarivorans taiwanensis]|uniref:hypothetical protein n=1 Tax=Aliagarivorans taiwanensis TaxID=561966 RepID=UPI00040C8C22|nr:hypothetical protein [Aliagarivorans taiwanensis]